MSCGAFDLHDASSKSFGAYQGHDPGQDRVGASSPLSVGSRPFIKDDRLDDGGVDDAEEEGCGIQCTQHVCQATLCCSATAEALSCQHAAEAFEGKLAASLVRLTCVTVSHTELIASWHQRQVSWTFVT